MKKLIYFALLVMGVIFVGCKDDNENDSGSVTFDIEGLFTSEYNGYLETTFTYDNVKSLSVLESPDGWDVTLSFSGKKITATAPASAQDGDNIGEVTLYGKTELGNDVYASITVGVVEFVALDDPANYRQANCLIVTEPLKFYTFNPRRRGENQVNDINVVSCDLLWRTPNMPIEYIQMMDDGSIGFYANVDEYDVDDDYDDDDVIEGNALIVGYDASDNIIWSWHVWVTDTDPTTEGTVTIDNIEFMGRNLGAFTNINTTQDYIHSSYGLYYQWGRKDPFIYPDSYNASGAVDTLLFNEDGTYVPHSITEYTSVVANLFYTTRCPSNFIANKADWLNTPNDNLWSSSEKSIYDPSPYGWRVAKSSEYATLSWDKTSETTWGDATNINNERYGAMIKGNDGNSDLFMAVGRKTYLTGTHSNLSADGTYKQWSGYYWSCDSEAGTSNSKALHFYLNHGASDAEDEVIVNNELVLQRANALQLRCVKDNARQ